MAHHKSAKKRIRQTEKISSFLKGICIVTGNFEKPLDNETTKQLMHEIVGEQGKVSSIKLRRNKLVEKPDGSIRAEGTDRMLELKIIKGKGDFNGGICKVNDVV